MCCRVVHPKQQAQSDILANSSLIIFEGILIINMPILVNLDTPGPRILQFLGLEKVTLTNFAHQNFFISSS